MILLGSIQRTELINMIEQHIGRERRLQVAAKRQKEARIRLYEETMESLRLNPVTLARVSLALPAPSGTATVEAAAKSGETPRRPSRFEVVKAIEDTITPAPVDEIQSASAIQPDSKSSTLPGSATPISTIDDVHISFCLVGASSSI